MATDLFTASEGALIGSRLSNLYINIGGQSVSTLTGTNIDAKLSKADQLLAFNEKMVRHVNPATGNNLFSAGELSASYTTVVLPRTQSAIYIQKMFAQGQNIADITIYRADDINNKLTVTEEIVYQNCIVTSFETNVELHNFGNQISPTQKGLDTIQFQFRYLQRQDTAYFFDQTGAAKGQDVSLINFPQGTLGGAAAAGGGGGAAPAAGGGDAGGGAAPAAPAAGGGDAGGGAAAGGGGGSGDNPFG